jgi:hypothetical protein
MSAKKQVKDWVKMFRQIPPQSHFTGIDDKEAIECVKVLINILLKETNGTTEPIEIFSSDGKFYLECLKQLELIKVKR